MPYFTKHFLIYLQRHFGDQVYDLKISICAIDKIWSTQESSGLIPDLFSEIKSVVLKNENISLNIKCSRILSHVSNKETGW